ncbi:MAG: hypothetical protein QM756_37915 [Polyangiaceae bacterium]
MRVEKGGPYMLPDGSAMYFHGVALDNSDLYRAERGPNGFTAASLVDGANSAVGEAFPVVTADELTIYFLSDRPAGVGAYDIWVASRSSTSDPFSNATPLDALNTPETEMPSWVSPDGCRLYFDRGGSFWQDNQILVAERTRN